MLKKKEKIMTILAIETSCDETAICLMEAMGTFPNIKFRILSNAILSQVKIHIPLGGVVPNLAKREHAKHLIPLLEKILKESKFYKELHKKQNLESRIPDRTGYNLKSILIREPELLSQCIPFISRIKKPPIDAIAVTYGPGLEPALWVGINFARALSYIWKIPIIPINHMEGHIFSGLLRKIGEREYHIRTFKFPLLALLISGAHTELVLSKKWLNYKILGETRDDAVGEAFDKVARMLGLPYPGGPEIAKLAEKGEINNHVKFPRPMINSEDLDFSFSGLKTSVLYFLKKVPKISSTLKAAVAYEFENAVAEVLITKTLKALKLFKANILVVGGGVSANKKIRTSLETNILEQFPNMRVYISPKELTGDNALMIGAAAYARYIKSKKTYTLKNAQKINATGNLRLS